MNFKKLKEKIKKIGLKHNFLAKQLNITATSFARKINGRNEFTIDEMKRLSYLLKLNDKEKIEFFLK